MIMGDLTVTAFVSLDGVMQGPGHPDEDRSGGFGRGGWLVPHVDEAFGQTMSAIFTRVDAFLLGRGTYQIFAGYWPKVTDPKDPIAGPLNALPKYVASRTLETVDWNGASLVRDVAAAVKDLKAKHAREIQVHGSPGLLQTLFAEDLVDVLTVLQFPVVLGAGKRLFAGGAAPMGHRLVSTTTTTKGVVISTYRRVGPLVTGSVLDTPPKM
jgi:dihydrofolate reductase